MNRKRFIITLGILGIVSLSFFMGWKVQSTMAERAYSDSLKPAADLLTAAVEGEDLSVYYEKASEVYRKTNDKASFEKTLTALRGYSLTSSQSYSGDVDNQVITSLAKEGKSIDVTISTVEEDNTWKVSGIFVTQQ